MKITLPRWTIEIRECELIPRGYGVTYFHHSRMTAQCHWLGVHMVIGGSRKFYYWFVHAFYWSRIDKAYEKGYEAGIAEGKRQQLITDAEKLINIMDSRNELVKLAARETIQELFRRLEYGSGQHEQRGPNREAGPPISPYAQRADTPHPEPVPPSVGQFGVPHVTGSVRGPVKSGRGSDSEGDDPPAA